MKNLTPLACLLLALAWMGQGFSQAATPLVNHDDSWRYHKGTNAPQADWKTTADGSLDGTAWAAGNGGFGYANNGGVTAETNNCQTILADMYNKYTSLYFRRQFTVASPVAADQRLYLRMDWDDCFIAWVDGTYLTNMLVSVAPAEPAYNWATTANHESSLGNSSPNPAVTFDLGPAAARLAPGTQTLAIMGINGGGTSRDFIQVADLYLDSPPAPVTNTWRASNSPIIVTTNVSVPANSTLLIEPGATVQFGAGVRVIVDGLLVAVGTPSQRIRFTRSTASDWSGFSFTANHQSNVFAYADFEYASGSGNGGSAVIYINDSQVSFVRDTFLRMDGHKYMDVWYPQVTIRNNVFGDVGAAYMFTIENLAPNGWFIVDGNLFGTDTGDTDIFHLNHVSVKNGPKAVLVNNVFLGAGDDHVDDNESDSHIEGNLFLNFTTNHPPRSASCAVTTGEGSGVSTNLHTQRLTVVRNIFWGCDYGIINKDGSYVEVYNCVFVNNRGGIIFDEPWRTDSGPGRACYIEGCIFWNNWPENGTDQGTFAYLTNSAAYTSGRYYRGATQVTVNNSILPSQYHYLGSGNRDANPGFVSPTNLLSLSPTNPAFAGGFDGFDANAFLFTNHFIPDAHLLPSSPARGGGPNGTDLGIYVSDDATVTGEPPSPTAQTNALLKVGGLDLGGYSYRLIGPGFTNDWSSELQSLQYVSKITLAGTRATATCANHGFSNGDRVEVTGADSLCPYYNGTFAVTNVTAGSFDYTVSPGTNLLTGEPLTIVWPIRNEGITDIWCRKLQNIQFSGLGDGTYRVEVVRQNTLGVWQSTNTPTQSLAWTVITHPPEIALGSMAAGVAALRFHAVAGQSYTIQFSDMLAPANWQILSDVLPSDTNGVQVVTDQNARGQMRFYRLLLPQRP